MRHRLVCRAMPVVVLSVVGKAPTAVGSQEPRLELREATSIRLPRGAAVLGGTLASGGEILLWTPSEVWEYRNWRSGLRRVCAGMQLAPRYVVRRTPPTKAEIFDSLTSSVVTVDTAGRCVHTAIDLFDRAESVIAATQAAWAQVETPPTGPPIVRWIAARHTRTDTIRMRDEIRLGRSIDLTARGAREVLLLGESAFPFRLLKYKPGHYLTVVTDPGALLTGAERAALESWTALPAIRLDRGYLQVLADPRSDERRLMLFDNNGRLLHSTTLDVAMGLLDADPRLRTILAVRNVGFPELVIYTWRWRAPGRSRSMY